MKRILIFSVIVLIDACPKAHGAVTEFFGDHNGWFGAVGGEANVTTIDFTDFPINTTITNQFAESGVTFEGLNFTSGPFTNYHDLWGLHVFNWNDLYFDEPINWIAADILGTMRIQLYQGDQLFFTSNFFGVSPNNGFGGLISDQPFDHVRIFDPADSLLVIDDLHFGPPIVVPVPGALCPLILAVCTVPRKRRR